MEGMQPTPNAHSTRLSEKQSGLLQARTNCQQFRPRIRTLRKTASISLDYSSLVKADSVTWMSSSCMSNNGKLHACQKSQLVEILAGYAVGGEDTEPQANVLIIDGSAWINAIPPQTSTTSKIVPEKISCQG